MDINLNKILTENRNPNTLNIDKMSSLEIAKIMNKEDENVTKAIKKVLKKISNMIDLAYESLKEGGRIIYIGAGTSGRLAVCDASEIPPTFGVDCNTFIGLMAGGDTAFLKALEGAEDNKVFAVDDLKKINLKKDDLVIGVAASGRTPYVIGGLEYAKYKVGTHTGAISCNLNSEISKYADVAIEVIPGPEVITGSTRLKAGTCQKLILNMISTGAMIKMGKVYSNLMVDVVPTNEKLKIRAENIIMQATSCSREKAKLFLVKAHNKCKVAIIMILKKCSYENALKKLDETRGHINKVLEKK